MSRFRLFKKGLPAAVVGGGALLTFAFNTDPKSTDVFRVREEEDGISGISRVGIFSSGPLGSFASRLTALFSGRNVAFAASRSSSTSSGDYFVPKGPVVEEFTELTFPVSLDDVPGSGKDLELGGVSIRCMLGYCKYAAARAYAYALYVDPASLGSIKGFAEDGEDHGKDDAFHAAVRDLPGPKAIYLQFARSMPPAHIAKGFDRTLVKLVRVEHGGTRKNSSKPALRELIGYFSKSNVLNAGSQVVFSISADGESVTTVIDGKIMGKIDDAPLCRAIMAMYFGPHPVSKKGKRVISEGLIDKCRSKFGIAIPAKPE